MTGHRQAELQELAELAAAAFVPTEAYLEEYQLLEATIDEVGVVRTALRRTRGAGVRAVAKGAIGFAHTTDCTWRDCVRHEMRPHGRPH
jgi:predicted Zn-dependent protease